MERELKFRGGKARVGSDFDEADQLLFLILGICPTTLVDLSTECPVLDVSRGKKRPVARTHVPHERM